MAIEGLGPRIASALDQRFGRGYDFSLGRTSMSRHGLAPTLGVDGLTLKDSSGRTIFTAPRAEVSVALLPLIGGRVVPKRLEVFDVEVRLALLPDGSIAQPIAPGSDETVALTPPLADQLVKEGAPSDLLLCASGPERGGARCGRAGGAEAARAARQADGVGAAPADRRADQSRQPDRRRRSRRHHARAGRDRRPLGASENDLRRRQSQLRQKVRLDDVQPFRRRAQRTLVGERPRERRPACGAPADAVAAEPLDRRNPSGDRRALDRRRFRHAHCRRSSALACGPMACFRRQSGTSISVPAIFAGTIPRTNP